jgi:ATP-dependent protease HslVU (ClpYQ) peptidase subunit
MLKAEIELVREIIKQEIALANAGLENKIKKLESDLEAKTKKETPAIAPQVVSLKKEVKRDVKL